MKKRNEQNITELWHNFRQRNTGVMSVLEGGQGPKKYLKK